ncbi:MAG: TRAP transporter substrate-binding protein DctP [Deltaproteobacteria bacterium]|nr:MAG: TRAP transporter substrate-binding protein DctP [Deltaproteobacteria bacterium]
MKKTLLSLIILFLAGSPALAQDKPLRRAQDKPEYVVKLSAIAPDGTSWSAIGHQFADYIYEKSGGRMKVVWYLGSAMGDESAAVRKIRLGQLQGGVFTVIGMAKIVPEIRVLMLPGLFKNYDEVDYIIDKTTPTFAKMFEEKGFKLFGWVEVGFAYVFSTKPVHTLDDIGETKVWNLAGDPFQQEVIELQGYKNTVNLELFDVLMGLQTGLVETFFAPYYACLALQWYQYPKYVNTAPVAYSPGGVLVNKKFFDSLPPDLQNIYRDANKIYMPKLIPIIRKDHAKALEGFIKEGIKVIEPTPEIEEQNERMARKIREKLGDKYYPKWLLAEILNGLTKFRAGMAK